MRSEHAFHTSAAPQVAGPAPSRSPDRWHRAPAAILAERNTPFSSNEIKALRPRIAREAKMVAVRHPLRGVSDFSFSALAGRRACPREGGGRDEGSSQRVGTVRREPLTPTLSPQRAGRG